MADPDKIGTAWRDDELDVIVADYFAMLAHDLAGRPYVKSRHSADLMSRIGRTHRSVEFKHQNISAVLDELGMPPFSNSCPLFRQIDLRPARFLFLRQNCLPESRHSRNRCASRSGGSTM
jgi:hypothetical protein